MDIYTHFGLNEPPFRLSPDPRFLYLSDPVKEALAKTVYVTTQRVGPLALTGPIGSGKTSLLRRLYAQLQDDPTSRVVLLFAPNIRTANGFLRLILEAFGVKTERAYVAGLRQFETYLLAQYAAGITPVLLVDEAQNLPREALRLVHYLLNYETNTEKLLQIVLSGQEDLGTRIRRYRELASRLFPIAMNAMSPADLEEMLRFRWLVAGGSEPPFTPEAYAELFLVSKGLPRDAIKVADEALRRLVATKTPRVDRALITILAREFHLTDDEEAST